MMLLYIPILLLLLVGAASAQSPAYRNYTVKDGLPSSEVFDVFQDSKGYMWFATDAGVSRFDGYHFRNFSTRDGLADNTIFGIYEDHRNRLWFRSHSGKLSYFLRDNFYSLDINETIAANVKSGAIITSLYVDRGDTVWLGYSTGKYFKVFDFNTAHPGFEQISVDCLSVRVDPDKRGMVWNSVIAESSRFFRVSVNNQTKSIVLNKSVKGDSQHFRVATHAGGWIVCIGSDLYGLTTEKIISHVQLPARIIALANDASGNLWAGVYGRGALCFPGSDLTKQPTEYFPTSFVTDVYQDREQGYWFTTLSEGVFYMPCRNIRNYSTGSTSDKRVTALATDNGGNILAGLFSGKLCLFNAVTEQSGYLRLPGKGPVKNIICDSRGDVWICMSHAFGNLRYPYARGFGHLYQGYARSLYRENDSSLLIFAGMEILRLNIRNRTEIADLLPLNPTLLKIQSIWKSRQDLWIGCSDGLWQYDGQQFTSLGEKFAQLKNRVDHIIEPVPDELWLATKGYGIIVFRKNEGRCYSITPADGLASDICRYLYRDSTGTIWAGTNKGISKIRRVMRRGKVEYSIENINTHNGLTSNEVKCITRAGDKLWVGTTEGLSVLDIDKIGPNTTLPPVYITTVSIHGRPAVLKDNFELQYNQNFISIDFVGLSYKNSGKVRYKLKMEGIDRDWVYTDQPNVQYTTLPPGSYTFVVYAMNNDGYWSSVPAITRFFIEAPYWEKWWFRTGAGVSLTGSIFLFFLVRYNSLKRTEREKTTLSKKIMETELKALRAQMNPHFIFNALNSIQNYILENDVEAAHKYLGKFSRLIRNVLNNSKVDLISLEEELQTLTLYIELEALRFKGKFDYAITIEESIDTASIKIPGMLIQPFVENAIWHGFMLKEGKGLIEIKLKKDRNDRICCIVRDNGIGREQASKNKSRNIMHKSTGIALARERLEAISMRSNTDLGITIQDLHSEDGSPAGTEVKMYFQ